MALKRSRSIIGAVVGATALGTVCQFLGGAPAIAAPTVASSATQSVIVVLHDQLSSTPPSKAHISARKVKATSAQDAVLARLGKLGGTKPSNVKHFTSANAFSLTVTPAQAAALAADPSVAMVVPDKKIEVTVPQATAGATTVSPKVVTPSATPAPGACPTDPSKPLLEPEALSDTNTASDNPAAKTAQQLVDGTGVKVAYIADGINPDNPDFIRANGQHVITDYKAFSADGPAPQDGGAEAYGDASAIAAQGLVSHDLSRFVNPAYALPTGCNIRILGMSPGASIVALKIDFYTTSIVQAIDYAVTTDHVDVINESFGGSPIPDAASRSAISLFNDAAVAAGATVTISSGDAGTTSTIGNPATDRKIISVAANTNSRGYAQTGYGGFNFSNGKWINDEISSLSSGGYTQSGTTVDLTAPGESGWAVCDPGAPECRNYNGGGGDVQLFGGTSQSAPLTAGAAALVIEAYRRTHGGASPTPALVKTLLTSTAKDLGLPTYEQGSGLLDSRAAVEAALTYPGATTAAPAGLASNIALSTNQIDIAAAPGTSKVSTIGVRNVGTKSLTVATSTRDFTDISVQTQTTTLNNTTDPTFPYATTGAPWAYKKITFKVPAGTDRLAAALIWKGTAKKVGTATVTPVVRLTVLDPSGTYVANSRPQGGPVSANYANLDVRRPVAGTWTAILYTNSNAAGYSGDVSLRTTAQRAIPVGTVTPAVLTLAPGQSANVNVTMTVPAASGDTSQAIVFGSSGGHQTAVPVVLRAIVPISAGMGTFNGTITGGNARAGSAAQSFSYAFDVPAGLKDLGVRVRLATNPGDQLEGVLVDPNDETQSIGSNAYTDAAGNLSGQGLTMQLNTAIPLAGRWRVIILVQNPVTGNAFTENFSARILFNQSKVTAPALPTSTTTTLTRGRAVSVPVNVTNTGIAPINVQIDPRTSTLVDTQLVSPFGSQTFDLPAHAAPTFIVPPNTDSLVAAAVSSLPALVELTSSAQGIDVVGDLNAGKGGSTVSVARVKEPHNSASTGIWYTDVNEIGPVGEQGAPTGTSTVSLIAHTRTFATDITSSTGDFYAVATNPAADTGVPVTIAPGQTKTVMVTIKPTAPKGTKVSGILNIITPPSFAYPTFNTTGDVITRLPFAYVVG